MKIGVGKKMKVCVFIKAKYGRNDLFILELVHASAALMWGDRDFLICCVFCMKPFSVLSQGENLHVFIKANLAEMICLFWNWCMQVRCSYGKLWGDKDFLICCVFCMKPFSALNPYSFTLHTHTHTHTHSC